MDGYLGPHQQPNGDMFPGLYPGLGADTPDPGATGANINMAHYPMDQHQHKRDHQHHRKHRQPQVHKSHRDTAPNRTTGYASPPTSWSSASPPSSLSPLSSTTTPPSYAAAPQPEYFYSTYANNQRQPPQQQQPQQQPQQQQQYQQPPFRGPYLAGPAATMSSKSKPSSSKGRSSHKSIRQLIESLQTHRVNTLTELCRIERVAATCESEEDSRAFQGPMTGAWEYYVNSNQLLTELRGLTRSYPFCGDVLADAHMRVRTDPDSNRSWNLAWLCLVKIRDDNLISIYARSEAAKPEMWAGREADAHEVDQLAQCFEYEWIQAVTTMLRHWSVPPTWY